MRERFAPDAKIPCTHRFEMKGIFAKGCTSERTCADARPAKRDLFLKINDVGIKCTVIYFFAVRGTECTKSTHRRQQTVTRTQS